jgi:hypothetical protein
MCRTADPGELLPIHYYVPDLEQFCNIVVRYRTWMDYVGVSVGTKEELARLLVTVLHCMGPHDVALLLSEYELSSSEWIPGSLGWDIANGMITLGGMPFRSEEDVSSEVRLTLRGTALAAAIWNRDGDALFALMWSDE